MWPYVRFLQALLPWAGPPRPCLLRTHAGDYAEKPVVKAAADLLGLIVIYCAAEDEIFYGNLDFASRRNKKDFHLPWDGRLHYDSVDVLSEGIDVLSDTERCEPRAPKRPRRHSFRVARAAVDKCHQLNMATSGHSKVTS